MQLLTARFNFFINMLLTYMILIPFQIPLAIQISKAFKALLKGFSILNWSRELIANRLLRVI